MQQNSAAFVLRVSFSSEEAACCCPAARPRACAPRVCPIEETIHRASPSADEKTAAEAGRFTPSLHGGACTLALRRNPALSLLRQGGGFEVRDEVLALVRLLDARENHLGALPKRASHKKHAPTQQEENTTSQKTNDITTLECDKQTVG